jgi:hypothetical protein
MHAVTVEEAMKNVDLEFATRFHLRLLLSGAVAALMFGHAVAAHAANGNGPDAVLGVRATAEKGTGVLACGLFAACRINGVFYRSFSTTNIVQEDDLEEDFRASGIGFGSIVSFTDADHVCWTGERSGGSSSASADARECAEVFVDAAATQTASTCANGIISVASGGDANDEGTDTEPPSQCYLARTRFDPPVAAGDLDYVFSFDENDFGGDQVTIYTCSESDEHDKNVVAQCLTGPNVPQDDARVLAHQALGGYDGSTLGALYYRK